MHIQNIFKNGKPNISLEKQSKIIIKVIANRYRREKSTAKIARKVEVSQSTIAYVLKKSSYKKMKPI